MKILEKFINNASVQIVLGIIVCISVIITLGKYSGDSYDHVDQTFDHVENTDTYIEWDGMTPGLNQHNIKEFRVTTTVYYCNSFFSHANRVMTREDIVNDTIVCFRKAEGEAILEKLNKMSNQIECK